MTTQTNNQNACRWLYAIFGLIFLHFSHTDRHVDAQVTSGGLPREPSPRVIPPPRIQGPNSSPSVPRSPSLIRLVTPRTEEDLRLEGLQDDLNPDANGVSPNQQFPELPSAIVGEEGDELSPPVPGVLMEQVEEPGSELELVINRSVLYRLTRQLSNDTIITFDNEQVVDVQPLADETSRELRFINVIGIGFGEATVRLIDQERSMIQTIRVRVTIDEEDLQKRINTILPGANVTVRQIAQNVILEGQVPDARTMADVLELVRSELRLTGQASVGSAASSLGFGGGSATSGGGEGGTSVSVGATQIPTSVATPAGSQPGLILINRVRVPGPRQVQLRVKIAEMNRSAIREFGVNFQHVSSNDVIGSLIGGIAPIGVTPGDVGIGPDVQLFGIFDNNEFSLFLNALRQNDLVRILASPTLVTLDGQPARFLSGGSFPFPVPQAGLGGVSAISIDFRDFGALLEFLPTILEDDVIRLDVQPVFSELNPATGTSVAGTSVPGLTERSARTVVQLREGQTLAIAGLFSIRNTGSKSRVPLLGDLPVFGQLFTRTSVDSIETELVVLVTPELIDPIEGPLPGPAPGELYQEPNDLEFFFLGRIEGMTRHPYRATVDYKDPFHLMKHFRSEAHWVVGPHGFSD